MDKNPQAWVIVIYGVVFRTDVSGFDSFKFGNNVWGTGPLMVGKVNKYI